MTKNNSDRMNTRLTTDAKRLLKLIAHDRGVSMTAILEQLIRDEAKRRKMT